MTRQRLGFGWWTAAVWFASLGCTDAPQARECEDLCKHIQGCDFFPSPLGTGAEAEENCQERCELSSSPASTALRACSDLTSGSDAECNGLRQCLIQAAGFQVLGRGDFRLRVELDTQPDTGCAAELPPADGAGGEPSWCDATGVALVVPFVETLQTRFFGEATDCGDLPTGDFVVRSVPAGRVDKVGVELRGATPSDTTAAAFCAAASTSGKGEVLPGKDSEVVSVTVKSEKQFACDVASQTSEACQAPTVSSEVPPP